MGYWRDKYGGDKSRDFIDGVKAGVEAFAIWDCGQQYVGVLKTPLHQVWSTLEEQLGGDEDAKDS